MPVIAPGKPVPDFTLVDQHGKTHSLSDYRGRPVVVFVYPRDDTPACTAEACAFRDHLPDFRKDKIVVLGLSPDTAESHAVFDARHALGLTLLADPDRVACLALGAWAPKTVFGTASEGVVRTTYLLDAEGRTARRWDRVRVQGHVAEVLAAARAMRAGKPASPAQAAAKPVRGAGGSKRRARAHDSDPPFSPVRGSTKRSMSKRPSHRRPGGSTRPR